MAYRQKVEARIRQNHQAYHLICNYMMERGNNRDVLVMAGAIVSPSVGRVTHVFVKDIEALLIHENKPRFNVRHKHTYEGRPIVVVNGGDHHPLKRIAKSSTMALNKWRREGGPAAMRPWLADD